jgi:hypothetical protein
MTRRWALVQAGVDGGEHHSALLNQRLSRTHRHIADLASAIFSSAVVTTPLASVVNQPSNWNSTAAWWVEGHGHRNLADVVHTDAAFNLGHLRDFNLVGLRLRLSRPSA